jgi:hypothetical protein
MSSRTLAFPLVAASLTLILSGACIAQLSGCQSMGNLMGSKTAMELLAPALKDAANSYLSNISQLTSSLKNVKGYQDALKLIQDAEPMVKQASSAYQTLAATSGEDRANLISAFGPQFKSTNSGFTSQIDKLKGNSSWGQLVTPLTDRVKLFQ